ncbi:MAG TPA: site-2 protease family protein [Clostridia bacterium]|nr:site-2 protease family protein [Clostridia bacterium]
MLANLFSVESLKLMLYRIPAIMIALSFHEFAHAYAAYKKGDPTAYNLGRMTLNPLRHVDPIGILMLVLVGFGWAKPVPINPRNFRNIRRDEIVVSLAGVVTNFVLAFLAMGIYILAGSVLFVQNEIVMGLLWALTAINLGLCFFNLIPIPPLDGYHVLQNLLIRRVNPSFWVTFERYGSFVLILLLITGGLTGVLSTIITAVLNGFITFYGLIFGLL